MAIFFLIFYVVIFIFEIVQYIKCIKNKVKWSRLFKYEIFFIILSAILWFYYENLPSKGFMPGLTYLGEILFSFGAMVLYCIAFVITLITKLIIHLLEKKKQGNNYFTKIALIIAIILTIYGVNIFILDLKNDINVVKIDATIIEYVENEYGYKIPVVQYTVDDKTYKVMIEVLNSQIQNSKINDKVEIHYNKKEPSKLAYLSNYENLYIPCFLISLIIFTVLIIKSLKNNWFRKDIVFST